MYTEQEFNFIDNLLRLSSNNDLTYTDMLTEHNLDYDLYNKLFTDINTDPYKLITSDGNYFTITTLGREVLKIGFKQHLENVKKDQEVDKTIKTLTLEDLKKTDSRSRNAFVISIIAIVASLLIGGMQVYQTYYYNKESSKKSDNEKTHSNTSSEVNQTQHPSNFVDTTTVKIKSNSTK